MLKTPLSQEKKKSYFDLIEDNFFAMREKCENFNCIEWFVQEFNIAYGKRSETRVYKWAKLQLTKQIIVILII